MKRGPVSVTLAQPVSSPSTLVGLPGPQALCFDIFYCCGGMKICIGHIFLVSLKKGGSAAGPLWFWQGLICLFSK